MATKWQVSHRTLATSRISRRRRHPKNRSPLYVIRLLSRVLRGQIVNSDLYARGMNLATSIGSGSFFGLGGKDQMMGSLSDSIDSISGHQQSAGDVWVDDMGSSQLFERAETRSERMTLRSISQTSGVMDCNKNAVRHNGLDETDRTAGDGSHRDRRNLAPKPNRRRKTGARKGLVARSIGKPQSKRLRTTSDKTVNLQHALKRAKNTRHTRKKIAKLQKESADSSTSIPPKTETTRTKPQNTANKKTDTRKVRKDSTGSVKIHDSITDKQADGPSTSKAVREKSQRTQPEKVDMAKNKQPRRRKEIPLNLFEPDIDGPSFNKRTKARTMSGKSKEPRRAPERSKSKSSSRVGSPQLCVKNGSSDSLDWPSLPRPSVRSKGLVKETAKDIVKNKKGGSLTKITNKRWADIAAARSKGASPCKGLDVRQKTPADAVGNKSAATRTWASVAAKTGTDSSSDSTKTGTGDSSVYVFTGNEDSDNGGDSPTTRNTTQTFKKKKRSDSKAPCRDKITAEYLKSKGRGQLSKKSPKHHVDADEKARKLGTIRSRREKNRHRSEHQGTEDTPTSSPCEERLSEDLEKPGCSGVKAPTKSRSREKGNEEHREWRIDNMTVVYTNPVSQVISLNDPNKNKSKTPKNVNRCNNRAVTPSKTKSELHRARTWSGSDGSKDREVVSDSGTDLRARLSSISFQSSTASSDEVSKQLTPRQKTSKSKLMNVARDSPKQIKGEIEGTKQRKVSIRYRQLLRSENGRSGAKLVTEMQAKRRKTNSLEEGKTLTRETQRRLRHQRQQTVHNRQRSPAKATNRRKNKIEGVEGPSHFTDPPRTVVMLSSESGSSPQSEKEETVRPCRPTDNSGANNSLVDPDRAHTDMVCSPMNTPGTFTAFKTPVHARSAPELAKQRTNNVCVDLQHTCENSLDMHWWHAYLRQKTSRSPSAASSTTLLDAKTVGHL